MADTPGKKKATEPDGAEAAADVAEALDPATEEEDDTEDKITRERLIAEAHAFTGYDSHEVAGALASQKKTKFTPAEATKLTADWLSHPVTTEEA